MTRLWVVRLPQVSVGHAPLDLSVEDLPEGAAHELGALSGQAIRPALTGYRSPFTGRALHPGRSNCRLGTRPLFPRADRDQDDGLRRRLDAGGGGRGAATAR